MCPKADDPVSVNQEYRSIEISIGSTSNDMSGTVSITFNGYTTSFAADADIMTPNLCKEAFEKLDNVQEVICNATASTNGGRGVSTPDHVHLVGYGFRWPGAVPHTEPPKRATFSISVNPPPSHQFSQHRRCQVQRDFQKLSARGNLQIYITFIRPVRQRFIGCHHDNTLTLCQPYHSASQKRTIFSATAVIRASTPLPVTRGGFGMLLYKAPAA